MKDQLSCVHYRLSIYSSMFHHYRTHSVTHNENSVRERRVVTSLYVYGTPVESLYDSVSLLVHVPVVSSTFGPPTFFVCVSDTFLWDYLHPYPCLYTGPSVCPRLDAPDQSGVFIPTRRSFVVTKTDDPSSRLHTSEGDHRTVSSQIKTNNPVTKSRTWTRYTLPLRHVSHFSQGELGRRRPYTGGFGANFSSPVGLKIEYGVRGPKSARSFRTDRPGCRNSRGGGTRTTLTSQVHFFRIYNPRLSRIQT